MNILIIEDEVKAVQKLRLLIKQVLPSVKIVGTTDGVQTSINWLNQNIAPDLIMCDIQLTDGISFDIFKAHPINVPVIFTTAYNQYLLKAFELNSIDYLLKPIDKDDLSKAFDKYKSIQEYNSGLNETIIQSLQPASYKSKFLIKQGEKYFTISVEDILFLKADNNIIFIHTPKGRYATDTPLDELERKLDPNVFFRANRQYMIPLKSIAEISTYFNGKLKVKLISATPDDIIVSRQKAQLFKEWLNK